MKVIKFEKNCMNQGYFFKVLRKIQVMEVLKVYEKPRECKNGFWNAGLRSVSSMNSAGTR